MADLKEKARRLIELGSKFVSNWRSPGFLEHCVNHAPAIAQAYLDQCEEVERLRAGFEEAARLLVPGRRGQPGVPWDGWTRTEYQKYATGFSDYRDKVIGIARKARGDTDV